MTTIDAGPGPATPAMTLTFSVIVNTTDRAGPLRTLLRGLEQQSYPHFELIVVVGPTRDNTLEVLAEYTGRLRVLRCAAANLSLGRNIGLLEARGDIVAFVDDDAVPSRRWLEQLAGLFRDERLDATGGRVYAVDPLRSITQHLVGIVSSLAEQHDVRASLLESMIPDTEARLWVGRMMGTNMAFRRRALLDVGGFDPLFQWVYDDTDIAVRLANAGKVIQPVKECVVYHIPASNRNRIAHTYNVKWWIHTRSVVYYAIRNGRASGDTSAAILRRCLHFAHGQWLWAGQLRRNNQLTAAQAARMRLMVPWYGLRGAARALLGPRSLIDPGQARRAANMNSSPIHPYQDANSPRQPSVDPVLGHRAEILMPDPPVRVALLTTHYPPEQTEGIGRKNNLLARGLFALGHSVHVIARGETDKLSFYDGAYTQRLAMRLDRYESYRRLPRLHYALNHSHRVFETLRRMQLNDGVQVVDTPVWQVDGLVTAVSGLLPVIAHLQTATRQIADLQRDVDEDARLMGELEQTLIERARFLVPNTQATVETARRVYGLRPDHPNMKVVPHGIEPVPDAATRPYPTDRAADAPVTILYVGRLEKRKGIADLFAAIPKVLAAAPQARFVIAGADNSLNDGFLARTSRTYPDWFAERHPGLLDRVAFKGQVSDAELAALYQSCDLFVAPSLYESFGLIYLEAMNYAKPVIGCRAGGIPEVVDDGISGSLVDPESPGQLAQAILALLRSPMRLRQFGLAGRAQLLERFTHIHMARAMVEVYRRVIAQSTASGA